MRLFAEAFRTDYGRNGIEILCRASTFLTNISLPDHSARQNIRFPFDANFFTQDPYIENTLPSIIHALAKSSAVIPIPLRLVIPSASKSQSVTKRSAKSVSRRFYELLAPVNVVP